MELDQRKVFYSRQSLAMIYFAKQRILLVLLILFYRWKALTSVLLTERNTNHILMVNKKTKHLDTTCSSKSVRNTSNQLFVNLYTVYNTLSINPSVHKQFIRRISNPFRGTHKSICF